MIPHFIVTMFFASYCGLLGNHQRREDLSIHWVMIYAGQNFQIMRGQLLDQGNIELPFPTFQMPFWALGKVSNYAYGSRWIRKISGNPFRPFRLLFWALGKVRTKPCDENCLKCEKPFLKTIKRKKKFDKMCVSKKRKLAGSLD